MITWLYDEDRWPSGYAGGLVTKRPCIPSALSGLFPGRTSSP